MKRVTFVFAMLAFLVVAAYAGQDTGAGAQGDKDTKTATSGKKGAPLKTIAGKIGEDGKSFTADKDNKQWTLQNPDAVKGHEGHHVKLQAHVYADKNELHVMKVTMVGEGGGKKKGGS